VNAEGRTSAFVAGLADFTALNDQTHILRQDENGKGKSKRRGVMEDMEFTMLKKGSLS
jgi:hypothetical protein